MFENDEIIFESSVATRGEGYFSSLAKMIFAAALIGFAFGIASAFLLGWKGSHINDFALPAMFAGSVAAVAHFTMTPEKIILRLGEMRCGIFNESIFGRKYVDVRWEEIERVSKLYYSEVAAAQNAKEMLGSVEMPGKMRRLRISRLFGGIPLFDAALAILGVEERTLLPPYLDKHTLYMAFTGKSGAILFSVNSADEERFVAEMRNHGKFNDNVASLHDLIASEFDRRMTEIHEQRSSRPSLRFFVPFALVFSLGLGYMGATGKGSLEFSFERFGIFFGLMMLLCTAAYILWPYTYRLRKRWH